jgi:hypothetical protein
MLVARGERGEQQNACTARAHCDCGAFCRNRKARILTNRGLNGAIGLVFCSTTHILTWQLDTGRFMEHVEGVDLAQL